MWKADEIRVVKEEAMAAAEREATAIAERKRAEAQAAAEAREQQEKEAAATAAAAAAAELARRRAEQKAAKKREEVEARAVATGGKRGRGAAPGGKEGGAVAKDASGKAVSVAAGPKALPAKGGVKSPGRRRAAEEKSTAGASGAADTAAASGGAETDADDHPTRGEAVGLAASPLAAAKQHEPGAAGGWRLVRQSNPKVDLKGDATHSKHSADGAWTISSAAGDVASATSPTVTSHGEKALGKIRSRSSPPKRRRSQQSALRADPKAHASSTAPKQAWGWVTLIAHGHEYIRRPEPALQPARRMRYMQLWERRMATSTQRERHRTIAQQAEASSSTSSSTQHGSIFLQEMANDPEGVGYAYGGVDPGRIGHKGQPVEMCVHALIWRQKLRATAPAWWWCCCCRHSS